MSDTSEPGNAGTAFLTVVPQVAAGAATSLAGQFAGPLKAALSGVSLTATAMAATAAAAVVAVGVVGLNVASELGAGQKRIRLLTGATGDDLKELGQNFRNVVGSVAGYEIGDFAEALGKVRARTGLAGGALEELTKQELRLAKLTKSDVTSTIEDTTRMFGDWSIATENQGKALDFLFHASQVTGVEIGALSQAVVKYGAPFRQLGFSFEEATALIGKFEREGVNTGLVLGSMRIALGKMAKAGEEPISTFKRLVGEIKGAGDSGKANAIALQLFGARAGPDMAAAIREGRFEVADLLKQIGETPETLAQTEVATRSWTERLGVLFQRGSLWLEPIGRAMIDFRSLAIGKLEEVGEAVSKLVSGDFAGAGVDLGKLLGFEEDSAVTNALIRGLEVLGEFVAKIRSGEWGDAFTGLGRSIAASGPALLAALLEIRDRVVGFVVDVGRNLWTWLAGWVPPFVGWVIDAVPALAHALVDLGVGLYKWIWQTGENLADWVLEWVPKIAAWATEVWPATRDRLVGYATGAAAWIRETASDLYGRALALRDSITAWASDVFPVVRDRLATFLPAAYAWIVETASGLRDRALALRDAITDWAASAWERTSAVLGEYLDNARAWIAGAAPQVAAAVVGWRDAATGWVTDVWPGVRDRLEDYLANVIGWYRTAYGRVFEVAGIIGTATVDRLKTAGPAIGEAISGLYTSAVAYVTEGAGRIASAVGDALPGFLDRLHELASTFGHFLADAIPPLLEQAGQWLGALLTFIVDQGPSFALKVVLALGGFLVAAIPKIAGAILFIGYHLGRLIVELAGPLLVALGGLLLHLVGWIVTDAAPHLIGALVDWAEAFIGWVPGAIGGLLAALPGVLVALGAWILGTAVPWLIGAVVDLIGAFISWIGPASVQGLLLLADLLAGIIGWLLGTAVPWLLLKVVELTAALLSFLVKAIVGAPLLLGKLFWDIGAWLINTAVPWLLDKGAALLKAVLQFLVDAVVEAPGRLAAFGKALLDFFKELPGKIAKAAEGMWNGIANAFVAVINWLIDKWNAFSLKVPEGEVLGQKVGGYSLDTPDIQHLPKLALGGRTIAPGLAVVGEQRAEVVRLARGDTVFPLERALAELAGRHAEEGRLWRDLIVYEANDAGELLTRLDAEIGWRAR